jgi:hypothetical protein
MAGAGVCSTLVVIRVPSGCGTQLREAFPEAGPFRYAIRDHDPKFDVHVTAFLKATALDRSARVFRHLGKTRLRDPG